MPAGYPVITDWIFLPFTTQNQIVPNVGRDNGYLVFIMPTIAEMLLRLILDKIEIQGKTKPLDLLYLVPSLQ
jgi:hypothetical protein